MRPSRSPDPVREIAVLVSEIGLRAGLALDLLKLHPEISKSMQPEMEQIVRTVIHLQDRILSVKPTRRFRKDPPAGKES